MLHHFASNSDFHQNVQKLIGDTKRAEFDIVINYSLFDSC